MSLPTPCAQRGRTLKYNAYNGRVTKTLSPALEITGLIKDVGPLPALDGRMKRIVSNISLKAHFGAVTALLGANGAGKTTTIECAQGLQERTGGTISLLGQDPQHADAALRARVGVMLQDGGLPRLPAPFHCCVMLQACMPTRSALTPSLPDSVLPSFPTPPSAVFPAVKSNALP